MGYTGRRHNRERATAPHKAALKAEAALQARIVTASPRGMIVGEERQSAAQEALRSDPAALIERLQGLGLQVGKYNRFVMVLAIVALVHTKHTYSILCFATISLRSQNACWTIA